ncbi:MAG: hypothetical protein GY702_02455 [Desulfobulbaceae bacterium]|nr:hypothetical protein [Desulfobulbaceae bacterium]
MSSDIISGHVYSCERCAPLHGVIIEVKNRTGRILCKAKSDSAGKWVLNQKWKDAIIAFRLEGYQSKQMGLSEVSEVTRLLEQKVICYHNTLSCYPGDEISCFVNSPGPYSAKLFRHGLEKRLVLDLQRFPEHIQTVPDKFFVENGLSWEKSLNYWIPEDAKPGIYSLLIESEGFGRFAAPLLVSTPKTDWGESRILVLASTNNWQTYNLWGGRSRYRNYEDRKDLDFSNKSSLRTLISRNLRKILNHSQVEFLKSLAGLGGEADKWKFKKLSIARPFTNCALEGELPFEPFNNHLAAGEWRLFAWLEKMNIAYDVVSGIELHNNPEILNHYQGIILSTHCEYWSRVMYEAVRDAHCQKRLWILNFSGNTMYREVDFFEDGSLRCVSLYFSESCADESALIGVRLTEDDYGTAAAYKIVDPEHWLFSGAPVNPNSLIFGGLSLNQYTLPTLSKYDPGRCGDVNGLVGMGASGWETDKLTKTAPKDIKLVAKGCNKRGGADMVVREPQGNRGGMFSASSILFVGALLIDGVVSKIAENVICCAINGSLSPEKTVGSNIH